MQRLLSYYKAIGNATDLPLFVQTIGDMSVDLIVADVSLHSHHARGEG